MISISLPSQPALTFSSLNIGDPFIYCRTIYLRISPIDNVLPNAVDLATGNLTFVHPLTEIEKVDLHITATSHPNENHR